jgi:hypothetical protein
MEHVMRAFVFLLLLMIVACTNDAPPPADTPPARVASPLDDQLKALEKARAVEQTLEAGKQRTSDEIDKQSQ